MNIEKNSITAAEDSAITGESQEGTGTDMHTRIKVERNMVYAHIVSPQFGKETVDITKAKRDPVCPWCGCYPRGLHGGGPMIGGKRSCFVKEWKDSMIAKISLPSWIKKFPPVTGIMRCPKCGKLFPMTLQTTPFAPHLKNCFQWRTVSDYNGPLAIWEGTDTGQNINMTNPAVLLYKREIDRKKIEHRSSSNGNSNGNATPHSSRRSP